MGISEGKLKMRDDGDSDSGQRSSKNGASFTLFMIVVTLSTGVLYRFGYFLGNAIKTFELPSGDQQKKRSISRRVKFIPFPHRTLGSGDDVQCTWSTRPVNASSSTYDTIQRAVFKEGMCMPPSKINQIHIFSTAEAIECLSPTSQKHDVSVAVGGDSYTRQLFIGLADIVLGRANNVEILNAAMRRKILNQTQQELRIRHERNPSFPNIQFPCHWQCYGNEKPFSWKCSRCMNAFAERSPYAVGVVGAYVHVMKNFESSGVRQFNNTRDDIKKFISLSKRTIFASMPSYRIEMVPKKYQDEVHHDKAEQMYHELLSYLAPNIPDHPFVDFFQLTKSCFMNNCSYDGGHRSRYVNRWKAQLLLNTICEVNKESERS
ncbi:hypothetical protein ACHAWF_004378 [Thalassiosira exigua]